MHLLNVLPRYGSVTVFGRCWSRLSVPRASGFPTLFDNANQRFFVPNHSQTCCKATAECRYSNFILRLIQRYTTFLLHIIHTPSGPNAFPVANLTAPLRCSKHRCILISNGVRPRTHSCPGGAGEAPYGIGVAVPVPGDAEGNVDVVRCGLGTARIVSVLRVVGATGVDSIGSTLAPSSINVRTNDAWAPANGESGKTGCFPPSCASAVGSGMNRETRLTDSRSC